MVHDSDRKSSNVLRGSNIALNTAGVFPRTINPPLPMFVRSRSAILENIPLLGKARDYGDN